MGNLLDLPLARSAQPFGFRGPISPRLLAHFRHIVIEPGDFRFDFVQFAVGFRLRRRGLMNARGNSLSVAAEEGPTELGDEVGEAANNDEEVEPSKNQARWRFSWIGLGGLLGEQGKRLEKENQEGAGSEQREAAKSFQRAPLPWELPGPEGRPARMASAISLARSPLDRSISIRAALTSAAM